MTDGPAPKKKPAGVWDRAAAGREASAGYDLAANIIVCLFFAWAIKRWLWPEMPKLGYGIAVVLGAISGFYQLFKTQSPPHDDTKPH
jgi:hypothetical protein